MKKSFKASKSHANFSLYKIDYNNKKESEKVKPFQESIFQQKPQNYYRNFSFTTRRDVSNFDRVKNERKKEEFLKFDLKNFHPETNNFDKLDEKPETLKLDSEEQMIDFQIKNKDTDFFLNFNKEINPPHFIKNNNKFKAKTENSNFCFSIFDEQISKDKEACIPIKSNFCRKILIPDHEETSQIISKDHTYFLTLIKNNNQRINDIEKQLKIVKESLVQENKIFNNQFTYNELSKDISEDRPNILSDYNLEYIIKTLKKDPEYIAMINEDSRKYLEALFEKYISLNLPSFEIKLFELYELIKQEYQEFFDSKFAQLFNKNYMKDKEGNNNNNYILISQSFEERLSQNEKESLICLDELKNIKFDLLSLKDTQFRESNTLNNTISHSRDSKVKNQNDLFTHNNLPSDSVKKGGNTADKKIESEMKIFKEEFKKLVEGINIKINEITQNINSEKFLYNISSSLDKEKLNDYNRLIKQMIDEQFQVYRDSKKKEIKQIYEKNSEIDNSIRLKDLSESYKNSPIEAINFVPQQNHLDDQNLQINFKDAISKERKSNQEIQFEENKLLKKEGAFLKEEKEITFLEESRSLGSIKQTSPNKDEYSDQCLSQDSLTAKSTKEPCKEFNDIPLIDARIIWNNKQYVKENFSQLMEIFQIQNNFKRGIMNQNNHILVHILALLFNEITILNNNLSKEQNENCSIDILKDKVKGFYTNKICKYCNMLDNKNSTCLDLINNEALIECFSCGNLILQDIIVQSNKKTEGICIKCFYCLKSFCRNCLPSCSFCHKIKCKKCRRKCLFKNIYKTDNQNLIYHYSDIQFDIKNCHIKQIEFPIIPKFIKESNRVISINISDINYIKEDVYKKFIVALKYHVSLVKFYSINLAINTKTMLEIINVNVKFLENLKKFYISGKDFDKSFDYFEQLKSNKHFEIIIDENNNHKKNFRKTLFSKKLSCYKFINRKNVISIFGSREKEFIDS